jgi:hypothetical protein
MVVANSLGQSKNLIRHQERRYPFCRTMGTRASQTAGKLDIHTAADHGKNIVLTVQSHHEIVFHI